MIINSGTGTILSSGLFVAVVFCLISFFFFAEPAKQQTIIHWLRNLFRSNVGDDPPAFRLCKAGLTYMYIRMENQDIIEAIIFIILGVFEYFCARSVIVTLYGTSYCLQKYCPLLARHKEWMHILSQPRYCWTWLKSCSSV